MNKSHWKRLWIVMWCRKETLMNFGIVCVFVIFELTGVQLEFRTFSHARMKKSYFQAENREKESTFECYLQTSRNKIGEGGRAEEDESCNQFDPRTDRKRMCDSPFMFRNYWNVENTHTFFKLINIESSVEMSFCTNSLILNFLWIVFSPINFLRCVTWNLMKTMMEFSSNGWTVQSRLRINSEPVWISCVCVPLLPSRKPLITFSKLISNGIIGNSRMKRRGGGEREREGW